jgi:catechol 2,3-dioxygenase-like lactoylglutathione lyase family enzyme
MGIMLIVSNLNRSLDFYRDLVGATVVDHSPGAAVLAYGSGRILLRQVTDMSPVDRRVVHLHIQVPDVKSAYDSLVSRGVEFVHRPRVTSRGDRVELWAATFRDPDGHSIALTQWRDRDEVPAPTASS